MIELGDIVKNTNSGKIGIVTRINENGSILVLEKIAPFCWNTHDSEKTLEVIEKRAVKFEDVRNRIAWTFL